jgi:hypothetical protein
LGLFAREYQGPPAGLLPPNERAAHDAMAARRTLRFFAVAIFVLVVGAAFAFTVTRERDGGSGSSSSASPATTDSVTGATADDAIGPLAGADVGTYVDGRKLALGTATGDLVAVVSLDAYVPEAEARAAIGSVPVQALLAAAPGAHPSVVTGGLDEWAKSQRQADEVERDEIRKLLPTIVNDPAFKKFYESELVRLDAAIESVSPTSAVVYGLVVSGPADALKALGAKAGIRLVDVGHVPPGAPASAYRGLRPEETTKVGQPGTRPV